MIKNLPPVQEMRVQSLTQEAGGNGNPPQYPCLENSTDRGACQAAVHGVAKSWEHDWATEHIREREDS